VDLINIIEINADNGLVLGLTLGQGKERSFLQYFSSCR